MNLLIYIIILVSTVFSSNLKNWIDKKSVLVKNNIYKVEFLYSISKNKKLINKNMLKNAKYYSLNNDSTIIEFNDRVILCSNEKWEIIDLISKQRIFQSKDLEFEDFRNKLISIFIDKNYKIIQISKNKYLLSLNDYYLNMRITYKKSDNNITEISFYQAPYLIHIENLNISSLDSIPYNHNEWNNYDFFDFR